MKALLVAFVLFPLLAWGKLEVPFLSGPVVDEARLLDASEKARLESVLLKLQNQGKAQAAILIPASLQEYDIESYSIAVAEAWKLGKKGSDRGILIIVAPKERRMRIEVGYGLEGEIPDAVAKQIISDVMTPYFRERRFGDGMVAAVIAISQRLSVDLGEPMPRGRRRSRGLPSWVLLMALLFVVTIMRAVFSPFHGYSSRRSYRGGGWGGGGFGGGGGWGGGGFGGGGGGFGGGGSSGSW